MKYTLDQVKAVIAERVAGKIVPVHTEFKHRYKFPGGAVEDSVTQKNIIDKPHLIPWAIGLAIDFFEQDGRWAQLGGPTRDALIKTAKLLHRDTKEQAGTIGGVAHSVIEEWIKEWIRVGVRPGDILLIIKSRAIDDSRVWGAVRSAEAAFDKYNVVPVACELLVGVQGFGAGTLDLLVLNQKGELELWDYKTSNNVNDFYAIQVSAYKRFFERMSGLIIKRVRIIKLDKESNRFKIYNVPQSHKAFTAYRGLSEVYYWLNNGRDKLIEDKVRIKL